MHICPMNVPLQSQHMTVTVRFSQFTVFHCSVWVGDKIKTNMKCLKVKGLKNKSNETITSTDKLIKLVGYSFQDTLWDQNVKFDESV